MMGWRWWKMLWLPLGMKMKWSIGVWRRRVWDFKVMRLIFCVVFVCWGGDGCKMSYLIVDVWMLSTQLIWWSMIGWKVWENPQVIKKIFVEYFFYIYKNLEKQDIDSTCFHILSFILRYMYIYNFFFFAKSMSQIIHYI